MFKSTRGLFGSEGGATRSWLAGATSVALLVGTMALPAMAADPTPEPVAPSESTSAPAEATTEAPATDAASPSEEAPAPETPAADTPAAETPAETSEAPEAASDSPAASTDDSASPSDDASSASEEPKPVESTPAEAPTKPAPDTPSAATPDGSDSTDNAPPVLEQTVKGLTAVPGTKSISVYFPDFGYEKNYDIQIQKKDGSWESADAKVSAAKPITGGEITVDPPKGADHVAVVDGLKAGKDYDLRVVTAPTAAIADAATEDAQTAGAAKGSAVRVRTTTDNAGNGGNAVASQIVTAAPAPGPLAATVPPPAPNPTITVTCPLDIAVVVDRSGSIASVGQTEAMRNAVRGMMDALVGTGSHVTLISYNSNSTLDGQQVMNTQANADAFDAAIAAWSFDGSTNWQSGLRRVRSITGAYTPDLVLFLSDGRPNTISTNVDNPGGGSTVPSDYVGSEDFSQTALNAAVVQANAIKALGMRMLGVAIGSAGNPADLGYQSMEAVSGPNVYTGQTNINDVDFVALTSFGVLRDALVRLVNSACADMTKTAVPAPGTVIDVGVGTPTITYTVTLTSKYPPGGQNISDPLVDVLPVGTQYIAGTATIDGTHVEPGTSGTNPQTLTWPASAVILTPGQTRTVVYQVRVTTNEDAQTLTNRAQWHGFERSVTHTTNRVGVNLTIDKTVNATRAASYDWTIDKAVDRTHVDVAPNGDAVFHYTVTATPGAVTYSNWAVSGVITVHNTNPFALTGVNVTDSLNGGGGSCTVTGGADITIAATSNPTFAYTCPDATAASNQNTTTVTWDRVIGSGTGTASATVPFSYATTATTNQTVSVVDDKTDPANPVELGTATWNPDGIAEEFEYDLTKVGVAGQCTTYTNNAWLEDAAAEIPVPIDEDSQTVEVCAGADLTINKTVNASKSTLYTWLIEKDVDRTTVDVAPDGTATFHYTVTATPDEATDSNFAVAGTITVTNPNSYAVTATSITDTLTGGGTCTVTGGTNVVIPANSTTPPLAYTCTGVGAGTSANTATVTWDATAAHTQTGTANTGPRPVVFAATPTNQSVEVWDDQTNPASPVYLGTANFADGPTDFEYDLDLPGVAGACTPYTNTAWLEPVEGAQPAPGGTHLDEDTQTVEVCAGLGLTVEKTVTATDDRTYDWTLEKSVDDTRVEIADGGTATFNYTVTVTPNGYTDSNYAVSGTITVTNPNEFAVTAESVTDTLTGAGTCTVTDGTDREIAAGASVELDYTCTGVDATTTENTATVTWDPAEAHTLPANSSAVSDAVPVVYVPNPINQTVEVWDDQTDPANPVLLGTWDWTDGPHDFTYSIEKAGVAGTCTDYTNNAWLEPAAVDAGNVADDADHLADDSVTVSVCVGEDLVVSKTATGTFDREYNWTIQKLVNGEDVRDEQLATTPTQTFDYTVNVTQTGVTDSNWRVQGTINVHNPNDWQPITLTSLTDTLSNGGTCTLELPDELVVPAGGDLGPVPYTCTFDDQPESYSGTNTATAAWDAAAAFTPNGSASGTADSTLHQVGATNRTLVVTDTYTPPGGVETTVILDDELVATDVAPFTEAQYTYQREYDAPDPGTCTVVPNTARLEVPTEGAPVIVDEDDATAVLCSGRLDKTANPPEGSGVEAGDTITYTITVANPTARAIPDQHLVDTLPANVTLNQASINPAGTFTAADPATSAGTIEWTFDLLPGSVASPATVTFTYQVTVEAGFGEPTVEPLTVLVNKAEWIERKLVDITEHPVKALDADFSAFCVGDAPFYQFNVFAQHHELFDTQTGSIDWYQANDQGQPIDANGNPTDDPAQFVRAVDQETGEAISLPFTLVNGEYHSPELLWPGAAVDAEGNATAWPGWDLQNGVWVEVPDGGVREHAVVVVTVNPSIGGIAAYPPAASGCANPPNSPPPSNPPTNPPSNPPLAHTGSDVSPILLAALLAILGGGLMITWGQRRRRR